MRAKTYYCLILLNLRKQIITFPCKMPEGLFFLIICCIVSWYLIVFVIIWSVLASHFPSYECLNQDIITALSCFTVYLLLIVSEVVIVIKCRCWSQISVKIITNWPDTFTVYIRPAVAKRWRAWHIIFCFVYCPHFGLFCRKYIHNVQLLTCLSVICTSFRSLWGMKRMRHGYEWLKGDTWVVRYI